VSLKCVVGLGNPGRKYENTRHNAGYMVLRELAGLLSLRFEEDGFSEVASAEIRPGLQNETAEQAPGERLLLVRPLTYMNLSGRAVAEIMDMHHLDPPDLLVVHDDMDLPFGKIRVRRRGSSGGHRGIESIMEHLGTSEFPRLKIGIGRPPAGVDPADYVLQPFSAEESAHLDDVLRTAAQAVLDVFAVGIERAMARYNGMDASSEEGPR